jgi:hypothetical protein
MGRIVDRRRYGVRVCTSVVVLVAEPAGGWRVADTDGALSTGGATVVVVVCTAGGVGAPPQAASSTVAAVTDAAHSHRRMDRPPVGGGQTRRPRIGC